MLEYGSTSWVIASDGTKKMAVDADTDTFVFDDDLVQRDLLWRWKQSRGLPWQVEYAMFEKERNKRWSADAAVDVIDVGDSYGHRWDRWPNMPGHQLRGDMMPLEIGSRELSPTLARCGIVVCHRCIRWVQAMETSRGIRRRTSPAMRSGCACITPLYPDVLVTGVFRLAQF